MKNRLRSSSKHASLALFFLLCGCADSGAWLTGEANRDVTDAPSFVKKPEDLAQGSWPNLADVPDKRPVFSDMQETRDAQDDLLSDSYQAQALAARLRAEDLSLPPDSFGGFLSP